MADFALHPGRKATRLSLGEERAPLVTIDDAFADADTLLRAASSLCFEPVRGQGNHFPGVRAPLPRAYAEAMVRLIHQHAADFGVSAEGPYDVTLNHLQMVTTPRERLSLPQRLPHFDTFDPFQVACLHYLTPDDRGGTDFYRHRATGFERISPERFRPYTETLVQELRRHGHPVADYITGSNDQFEVIHRVAPAFNRVILYFSNSLHSGRIPQDAPLTDDPEDGRIMASVFVRFARRA